MLWVPELALDLGLQSIPTFPLLRFFLDSRLKVKSPLDQKNLAYGVQPVQDSSKNSTFVRFSLSSPTLPYKNLWLQKTLSIVSVLQFVPFPLPGCTDPHYLNLIPLVLLPGSPEDDFHPTSHTLHLRSSETHSLDPQDKTK